MERALTRPSRRLLFTSTAKSTQHPALTRALWALRRTVPSHQTEPNAVSGLMPPPSQTRRRAGQENSRGPISICHCH